MNPAMCCGGCPFSCIVSCGVAQDVEVDSVIDAPGDRDYDGWRKELDEHDLGLLVELLDADMEPIRRRQQLISELLAEEELSLQARQAAKETKAGTRKSKRHKKGGCLCGLLSEMCVPIYTLALTIAMVHACMRVRASRIQAAAEGGGGGGGDTARGGTRGGDGVPGSVDADGCGLGGRCGR